VASFGSSSSTLTVVVGSTSTQDSTDTPDML
jgi:hypothetical protein